MNRTRLPTSLEKFMMIEDDGVFYIGHASALVRINKKLFLFDPVWNSKPYGDYWTFFPKQINCDRILDKVDAIFISHIHEDHICEEILKRAFKPVIIMGGREPLTTRLLDAGVRVFEKPKFHWFPISSDHSVEAYFVPHSFNSIDSSVFIRSKDFCVYVGSDNFLSKELLSRIAEDVNKVDVAFVPYAFIHWYPHLIANMTSEEKEKETERLNQQSLEQARDFIKALRPKTTVPFGASLFYASGLDHILNRSLAKPDDLVDGPLLTGDFLIKDIAIYRDTTPAEFEEIEITAIDPHPAILNEKQVDRLHDKLKKSKSINELHQLIVNGVVIDLERPGFAPKYEAGIPSTEFNFNDRELFQWLDGEITFEQAIGTRRFTCVRRPNVYNLKVFEFVNNNL